MTKNDVAAHTNLVSLIYNTVYVLYRNPGNVEIREISLSEMHCQSAEDVADALAGELALQHPPPPWSAAAAVPASLYATTPLFLKLVVNLWAPTPASKAEGRWWDSRSGGASEGSLPRLPSVAAG